MRPFAGGETIIMVRREEINGRPPGHFHGGPMRPAPAPPAPIDRPAADRGFGVARGPASQTSAGSAWMGKAWSGRGESNPRLELGKLSLYH